MADVLLTHSYHLFYDRKQTRKAQPYSPLGTLYAAAMLRSLGVSVAVFDTMLNDPAKDFEAALAQHRPKLVVVYEDNFNFLSKMCLTRMREVAFQILGVSQKAGATVLVNGSDASDHAEDYLRTGFRCVLLGEAEFTLSETVQLLLKNKKASLSGVAGLAYLSPTTKEVVHTARRSQLRHLDTLPFPARDLIDTRQYRDAWKSAHGYFSLNLVASRGCPYRCNWCAKPIYGDTFSARSARSVAEEMRQLKERVRGRASVVRRRYFRAASEMGRGIFQRGRALDAAVAFQNAIPRRSDDSDTVAALRHSGCAEVWMGVESGRKRY